jgi:hypothetical protein
MTRRQIQEFAFSLAHPGLPFPKNGFWTDAFQTSGRCMLVHAWCDKLADGKFHIKKYKRIKPPYWGDPLKRSTRELHKKTIDAFSTVFWARLD